MPSIGCPVLPVLDIPVFPMLVGQARVAQGRVVQGKVRQGISEQGSVSHEEIGKHSTTHDSQAFEPPRI